VTADPSLVAAAKDFLERWLLRKDYDAAFKYLSPQSYACYELVRSREQPAATSLEDAGRRIRESLASSGDRAGKIRRLDDIIAGAESVLELVKVADHPYSRTFALTSLPTAMAGAFDCSARASGARFPATIPLEYGQAFGMNIRFRTRSGEAPVLRTIWRRETEGWRITVYGVELP
jgi:hypothetical protein